MKQNIRQFKRGGAPLFYISPSPCKERGIEGVRLITNFSRGWSVNKDKVI